MPRPQYVIQVLLEREAGDEVAPALAEAGGSAVTEVVRRQVASGVDVVNDGEEGKVAYSTYVKERLSGFRGNEQMSSRIAPSDLLDFPSFAQRVAGQAAVEPRPSPACTGPLAVGDHQAVRRDIANLQAAVAEAKPTDVFMTAASPGVIALFLPNPCTRTQLQRCRARQKPRHGRPFGRTRRSLSVSLCDQIDGCTRLHHLLRRARR